MKADLNDHEDRLTKIEEVYINDENTNTMNKLEEIAKNGGTIDAATLVESLKELKRELKVQIVDQGKSLKYNIAQNSEQM